MSTGSSESSAGAGALAPAPSSEFLAREERFNDIVALRRPDRVPVVPLCLQYFATRIAGVSNRDAGYDHELMYRCLGEATRRFDWDIAPQTGVLPSPSLEALGAKQVRWPGGDLPDDAPFQWVEAEYMQGDEVDGFLDDPNGFTLHTLFPRIAAQFEVLGQLPLPPVWWLANMYFPLAWSPLLAAPRLRSLFRALADVGDDAEAIMAATGGYTRRMAAQGYPTIYVGVVIPPFDCVSDYYRGLRGSTTDMFRRPEKLVAMAEMILPTLVAQAVGAARATGIPRIFIPMHRGAAGFMSDEQFARFYWPTFEKLLLALIEEGITPCPLFEGDYTPRLKYLATLPPGKVAAHFDRVDRRQFKEMCGDVLCFWGDITGSLLVTGTPHQVKDEVKQLIDLFSDTGALMIDGANTVPDEATPENVMAMTEAVHETGLY
jgi:uroporphyrinogen-III decarboxylase